MPSGVAANASLVLDVEQQLAIVDIALDRQPTWLRKQTCGLPFSGDDQVERRALLSGLDIVAG
jgi:hypothetical protein